MQNSGKTLDLRVRLVVLELVEELLEEVLHAHLPALVLEEVEGRVVARGLVFHLVLACFTSDFSLRVFLHA